MIGRIKTIFQIFKDQYNLSASGNLFDSSGIQFSFNKPVTLNANALDEHFQKHYGSPSFESSDLTKSDGIDCPLVLNVLRSRYFPDLKLLGRFPENTKRIVVFLPGNLTGGNEAINSSFANNLVALNNAVITWDWPLQGRRWDGRYFQRLDLISNVEREYNKLLAIIGTNLFDEYLSEFASVLRLIESKFSGYEIDVIGWSQGAHFSWYAPFFARNVRRIYACGSFAFYRHLVSEGFPHVHGFPHFPVLKNFRWDLDDLLARHKTADIMTFLIFGELDRGVLKKSIEDIKNSGFLSGKHIVEVKNTGHDYTTIIDGACLQKVKEIQG